MNNFISYEYIVKEKSLCHLIFFHNYNICIEC
jgi:hypothetical protein